MQNQLLKKGQKGYENIFPKTYLDAIKDRDSGMSLLDIIRGFNMYFLSYTGDKESTRLQIPAILRKEGLWITYVDYEHNVITEWYNSSSITDEDWSKDSNWRQGSNMLVGDITISSDGYWIIDGIKSQVLARGEQGITPKLRISDDFIFQVTYNEGKYWEDLGKVTNYLRIQKYIGPNEQLPTEDIAEGTIYMKGPYYEENDVNRDYPSYRMWVYTWKDGTLAWQDNGEFQSIQAGVVQETGYSPNVVMSQKAVTEKFDDTTDEMINIDQSLNPLTVNVTIKNSEGNNPPYELGVLTNLTVTATAKYKGDDVSNNANTTIAINKENLATGSNTKTYENISTTTSYEVNVSHKYDYIDKEPTIESIVNKTATFVNPCYFGYADTDLIDAATMKALSNKYIKTSSAGTYTITGTTSAYIWFCVPNTMPIHKITSGGFDVPFTKIEGDTIPTGYYCYRTPDVIVPGTNTFVIS